MVTCFLLLPEGSFFTTKRLAPLFVFLAPLGWFLVVFFFFPISDFTTRPATFFLPSWDGHSFASSSRAQILQQERYCFFGPFGIVPRLLLPYLRFCNKNSTVFFGPLEMVTSLLLPLPRFYNKNGTVFLVPLVGMVPRLLLPYLRFCNKNGTVFFWPA
jgi:hypothetical protein